MSRHAAAWGLGLALAVVAGCRRPQPGDPLRGLSAAERDSFARGRVVFDSQFTPATGLGRSPATGRFP